MRAPSPREADAARRVTFSVGVGAAPPDDAGHRAVAGGAVGAPSTGGGEAQRPPASSVRTPSPYLTPTMQVDLNSMSEYTASQSEYGYIYRSVPLQRMQAAAERRGAILEARAERRTARVAERAADAAGARAYDVAAALRVAARTTRAATKAAAAAVTVVTTRRALLEKRAGARTAANPMQGADTAAAAAAARHAAERERTRERRAVVEHREAAEHAQRRIREAADAAHASNLAEKVHAGAVRGAAGTAIMMQRQHHAATAMRPHATPADVGQPAADTSATVDAAADAATTSTSTDSAPTATSGVAHVAVNTIMSQELVERLLATLPAARSSADVRRFIDAARRRDGRNPVPCVIKRPASATHPSSYMIEQRTQPHPHAPTASACDIDLRNYAQQEPQVVIDAMISDAVKGGVDPNILAYAVLASLERVPRAAHPEPTCGPCAVPSDINPEYLGDLVRKAGLLHPTTEELRNGADSCYTGGRRWLSVPNHSSATDEPQASAVREILATHRAAHEYLDVSATLMAGPLIPHLICALGTTQKKNGKFRILHDGTTGGAANGQSSPTAYMPARMTSVDQFKRNLWALRKRAGPGAELLIFYRDVSKAFTRFPQAAGEMFLSVFQFDGHLHISLRSLFGLRSPGYICSAASTAVSEATNADYTAEEIMAFSAAYVDDFGGGTVKHDAPVAEERLDTHMSKSGLPQELIKRRVSAPIGPYIGLVWDPALMRCSLPPEKLEKTRRAAQRVAGARRMQAGELAEVLGIVEYAASVVPILGAFITEVRDCTRGASPRAWVTITQDARDEAEIWLNILDIHDGDHFIPESDREADCPTVLSDASTSNGLGFFSPEAGIYFSMPLDGALAATDGERGGG